MSALEQTLALVQMDGQLCPHNEYSDPSSSEISSSLEIRI
jgi:hypothetical protein